MESVINIYNNSESYLAILGAITALLSAISVVTPSKRLGDCVTILEKVGYYADQFGACLKKRR